MDDDGTDDVEVTKEFEIILFDANLNP